MKRKAALSIITAAFLIGVAACGNGNINSSGAAASNENSALQQSDAAENSTRKTSATEENADTEDASTENNADSNTDTEESAQNAFGILPAIVIYPCAASSLFIAFTSL